MKSMLAKFGITGNYTTVTHAIAVGFLFLYGAYSYVPAFATLCNSVYGVFPALLKQLVVAALALYVWYRNGQPTSGAGK